MKSQCLTYPLLAFLWVFSGCTAPQSRIRSLANLDATLWVQKSAEHSAACLQAYSLAGMRLRSNITNTEISVAMEQAPSGLTAKMPPAVILDVDETVLDNSAFQGELLRTGESMTKANWAAWLRREEATAIPGALEFCKMAKASDIAVFYVTDRGNGEPPEERERQRASTMRNLERLGFPLDLGRECVLVPGDPAYGPGDKSVRRQYLAKSHRIIMMLGDDLGDFINVRGLTASERMEIVNRHGDRWSTVWFVLPNPMYGSWLRQLLQPPTPQGAQIDELKMQAVRGFSESNQKK